MVNTVIVYMLVFFLLIQCNQIPKIFIRANKIEEFYVY